MKKETSPSPSELKQAMVSNLSLVTGGQRSSAVTYSIPMSPQCKSTLHQCSCCAEQAKSHQNNSWIFFFFSSVWAERLVFTTACA